MNAETEKFVMPAVSLNEQPASYTFTFTVPGIGKKDADLHVEGRTLTLKTHATWQNPAALSQVEAEFGSENYPASVDLPEMADVATLTATLENGILTVTVQKKPETQPRKIAIGQGRGRRRSPGCRLPVRKQKGLVRRRGKLLQYTCHGHTIYYRDSGS